MTNAHLWRRTRNPQSGVPAPLPPSAPLTHAGSLRRVWARFQNMTFQRRKTYTENVKAAYNAQK